MLKDITSMKNDQIGKVVQIKGGMGFCNKINSLGLREGLKIKKVSSMMLKGPQTIMIGHMKIALGYGMAKKVFVEVDE